MDRVLNKTVCLPESLWCRVEEEAERRGITRSRLVRLAVESYFKNV